MPAADSWVAGHLAAPATLEELAVVLAAEGFDADVGAWAVRLRDLPFPMEVCYVGNITPAEPFEVEGDGYGQPIPVVAEACARLARALAAHRISS